MNESVISERQCNISLFKWCALRRYSYSLKILKIDHGKPTEFLEYLLDYSCLEGVKLSQHQRVALAPMVFAHM